MCRFIDLVEIDLLERAEDDETRQRITNEINAKPVPDEDASGVGRKKAVRRRRPRMSAEQAQRIAMMADQYDKEVTGGR